MIKLVEREANGLETGVWREGRLMNHVREGRVVGAHVIAVHGHGAPLRLRWSFSFVLGTASLPGTQGMCNYLRIWRINALTAQDSNPSPHSLS